MRFILGPAVPAEVSIAIGVAVRKAVDLFDVPTDSVTVIGTREQEGQPRITAKMSIDGQPITDLVFEERDVQASVVKQAQLIVAALDGKYARKAAQAEPSN